MDQNDKNNKNRRIPDNSVAVGNPCHVIRAITDEDKKTCWSR